MRLFSAAVLSVALSAGDVSAQTTPCGPSLVVADESLKGTIEGKAHLLTKLFGQAEIGSEIQSARTDIFRSYPNAEHTRSTAYFQYVLCSLLFADRSLSSKEKIATWMEIRENLGGPTPSTRRPAAPAPSSGVQQRSSGCGSPNISNMQGNLTISGC